MPETKRMQLTVKERMLIASLLPDRGHVADLRVLRDLENELSFSPAEHEQLGIHQVAGVTTWNEQAAAEMAKTVDFCPRAVELIRGRLTELDQQGQLHKEFLWIYDRFCEEGGQG